jgi:hypothetical protein
MGEICPAPPGQNPQSFVFNLLNSAELLVEIPLDDLRRDCIV